MTATFLIDSFNRFARGFPILGMLIGVSSGWADWDVLTIPTDNPSERIYDLTFIDETHGWALISDGFDSRIARTNNGGDSWDSIYTTDYDGEDNAMLQFVSQNVGYFVPNDGFDEELLFRSDDGGMTFNPVTNPFTGGFFDGPVNSVFFFDENNGWAAGEYDEGMFSRTANGGTSWELRGAQRSFEANDLFFLNPMHAWTVGGGSNATDGIVLFTHDGGENWRVGRTQIPEELHAVRFVNEQIGWTVGDLGNIHVSINGGANWYPQASGTEAELFDVEPIDENIVFAVGLESFFRGVVLLTTNGGGFWRRHSLPVSVGCRSIERVGNKLWIGGGTSDATPNSIFLFRQEIDPANLPGIVFDQLPGGTEGLPYEFPLNAANGTAPFQWSLVDESGFGFTINSQSGVVSGIPNAAGVADLRVTLTDGNSNRDERVIHVPVIETRLSLASSVLPSVTHRTTFRHPLELEGGHKPYHFRILGDNPPSGIDVDQQGNLTGTPFETGNFDFTLEVIDSGSLPQKVTADFSLQVNPLLSEHWDIQHAHNRITSIHFFDESQGVATTWSGLLLGTDNGGRTWDRNPLSDTIQVDMDWFGDEGWILLNGGGVLHSVNRGVTWEETSSVSILNARGIRFLSSDKGWAYGGGVSYTEDGGQSWHTAATPPDSFYLALDFGDLMNGFAAGETPVFDISTDGGKTWTRDSLPGFPGKGVGSDSQSGPEPIVQFSPASKTGAKGNDQTSQIQGIYFLNAQEGWIGTNEVDGNFRTKIFHTENGGQTWTPQGTLGLGNTGEFHFLPDGETGWVGGLFGGNLRKTTNGGTTWDNIADFGGDIHLFDFQFLDEDTGWICANLTGRFDNNSIVDMEGAIWKTEDGGVTWTLQYGWPHGFDSFTENAPETTVTGPDFEDASFPSEKVGYAIGRRVFAGVRSYLYRTQSGGATWALHGELPSFFYRIEFPREWHGFGLSEDGSQPIFETVDGGSTWFPRHDVGAAGTLSATESVSSLSFTGFWSDIYFADDLHGWILRDRGTFDDNYRNVLRTTDGGKTWASSDLPPQTGSNRIFFSDPMNGWVAGESGTIDRSTDGGKTWETQIPPFTSPFPDYRTVSFIDHEIGVAGSTGGIISETTSGGEIWKNLQLDGLYNFSGAKFITCLKGWLVGDIGGEGGDSLVLQTNTGTFQSSTQPELHLVQHPLRVIESPDSTNAWVFGRYGVSFKYSAPTSAIRITTEELPSGRQGAAFSFQLESENGVGPFSWQLCGGRLPEGITLTPQGVLSGTPTEAGTFRITPAVMDSMDESAGKRFFLRIEPALSPTILTTALPNGSVGTPYQTPLEATGTMELYEWTVASGELPPGITLLPYGLLSGVPLTPGGFPFTLRVVDGQTPNGSAMREYLLDISGKFAGQTASPCEDTPILCIALTWYQSGSGLDGDIDGSGKVDSRDILDALESLARR